MIEAIERRRFMIGSVASLTAFAAFAAEPRHLASGLLAQSLADYVPISVGLRIGSVESGVVPEKIDESAETGQTVTRRYEAESLAPVMVVMSYHGSKSPDLKVHRPETCYKVAGFEVEQLKPVAISIQAGLAIPAVSFASQRADRHEQVLYWTRVGTQFPQSLTAQRWAFINQALNGFRADGLLVRISTIADDSDQGQRILEGFARELLKTCRAPARRLLLGPLGQAMDA